LIAGSATDRRPVVIRQLGSTGSYQAGTVSLITRSATTRRAGGAPPAWICWAQPGRHSVPDRWERDDSLAGGRNLHPAIGVSGWACPTLFWNAVDRGPSQSPGPAGPAERSGRAGWFAGRVPGGARRRFKLPSRPWQVQGTDSTGTDEPERPVAGLTRIASPGPRSRYLENE
jgi:hypothetical protein